MTWIPLDTATPRLRGELHFTQESDIVLVTDGERVEASYLRMNEWDPGDYHLRWVQPGRDSYDLSFEPTHWQPMPGPPPLPLAFF